MKHRPLKLQWNDLEAAFSNRNQQFVYYLDLVTGYVVLEGEGEEDDFDDQEQNYGGAAPRSPADDSTRLYIQPPDHALKLEWLKTFLDEAEDLDPEVKAELKVATKEEDYVAAVNDVLRRHPEGSDRWYLYRSDRKHDRIDEWIEEHSIGTVDPPPWKAEGSG